MECFCQECYPENYHRKRNLEYEMKQRSWGRLAKFLEFAEKKLRLQEIESRMQLRIILRGEPAPKTTKISVIGRKNKSHGKLLSGGSLVIKNKLGWSCSHLSKLLKKVNFLKLLTFCRLKIILPKLSVKVLSNNISLFLSDFYFCFLFSDWFIQVLVKFARLFVLLPAQNNFFFIVIPSSSLAYCVLLD